MDSILILGGDGYLGWPTAMYFSSRGHKVTVVDNYFRRRICQEKNIDLLFNTPSLVERAQIWFDLTGYKIKVIIGDLSEPELLQSIFQKEKYTSWPENELLNDTFSTVIHYAEQPSAPYSIMNNDTSNFTLKNNLLVTNNLLFTIKDISPETHIIKLGTMGEYGTPNIDIEEGWIDIKHKGRSQKFLFPRQASSIYHTSKIMDTDLLWYGVRTHEIRVTDLMQGPVYGIETDESLIDPRLRSIFNYDEIFGTVVNRFMTQAIVGHPLTVYGSGTQTRGYINLKDTMQCIYVSAINPAKKGELRIFNQITETFTVNEIANLVVLAAQEININCEIKNIHNPRMEAENHYYNPSYHELSKLGVKANLLTRETLVSMLKIIKNYQMNINTEIIFNDVKW